MFSSLFKNLQSNCGLSGRSLNMAVRSTGRPPSLNSNVHFFAMVFVLTSVMAVHGLAASADPAGLPSLQIE